MQPKPIQWNATDRRLAKAPTIADLRRAAKRRTPTSVFDYTDGAAEGEISLHRARQTYQDLEFRPTILQDVSDVTTTTTTTTLGAPSAQPFAFAPTGFTLLMHHEGEGVVARVAQRRGIPYALSTMAPPPSRTSFAVAPHARRWFQLYVWKAAAPPKN